MHGPSGRAGGPYAGLANTATKCTDNTARVRFRENAGSLWPWSSAAPALHGAIAAARPDAAGRRGSTQIRLAWLFAPALNQQHRSPNWVSSSWRARNAPLHENNSKLTSGDRLSQATVGARSLFCFIGAVALAKSCARQIVNRSPLFWIL